MRRFPAWSVAVIAVLSLLAGIVAGRLPWREWVTRPRGMFAGSKAAVTAAPAPPLHIRPVEHMQLEPFAHLIAEATWWRERSWTSNMPGMHIEKLRMVRRQKLGHMLTPDYDAELLMAHVTAAFWKHDADVLMVFLTNEFCEPVLTTTGSELSYQVVNVGTKADTYALVVRDKWSVSTGPNATTMTVYVYRKSAYQLREVFHEDTTYGHPPWGEAVWDEKSVRFRDGGRYLKDIVINAHVHRWHGHPDFGRNDYNATPGYYKDIDEDRVSVFRWDGERYVGRMNVGK